LLGDFGADVVHVEGPPFGPPYADPVRCTAPLLPVGASLEDGVSTSWVQYNRNKRAVGLDVARPEGRDIFLDLVRHSDIWVDSSRPGTFDKLKLSDAEVLRANRRIVIVHVSGFGQNGHPAYVRRPSYDLVAQAFSGFLACQGNPAPEPPMRSATAINDLVTGLGAATGALMAYIHAQKTGEGQVVDVAQYEMFFIMMENMALDYFSRGVVRSRHGNAHPRLHPYEVFPAKDGFVALAAPTPRSWEKLRDLVGLAADSQRDNMAWRVDHREQVNVHLRNFTLKHTIAQLEALGLEHDVAFAPILTMAEIASNPHYLAREMMLRWQDPVAGEVRGAGIAPKFSRTPGAVRRGAPWLGQDNAFVLGDILGYSADRQRAFAEQGIVGAYNPAASRSTQARH
jgi:crotonobetainyl-CoA:carnitine CoA-transferase CaiB-like acyl-CoA transferase